MLWLNVKPSIRSILQVNVSELVTMNRLSSSFVIGLVAQCFAIVAGIMPAFFGHGQVLAFVLVASALANIALGPVSLAVAFRLPVLGHATSGRDGVSQHDLASSSFIVCVFSSALVLIGGIGCSVLGASSTGRSAMAAAIILLGQGIFVIVQTVAVLMNNYAISMRMRLVYAGVVFMGTFGSCLVSDSVWPYVGVLGGSFIIAAAYGCSSMWSETVLVRLGAGFTFAGLLRSLRTAKALIGSQLFIGLSLQAGSIATVFMGAYAPAWAIANRVSAGFQTTAGQVLAPGIDSVVSRGLREHNRTTLRRGVVLGSLFGLVLSVLSLLVSVFLIYIAGVTGSEDWVSLPIVFWIAVCLYVSAQILLIPLDHCFTFLGGARFRSWWGIARFVALLPTVLMLRGSGLLVVLSAVGVVSMVTYFVGFAVCLRRSFREIDATVGADRVLSRYSVDRNVGNA